MIQGVVSRIKVTDDELKVMSQPLLLVHAQDDEMVPFRSSQKIKNFAPRCVLHSLPDGGHGCFITSEEGFERICRFLLAELPLVFAPDPLLIEAQMHNCGGEVLAEFRAIGACLASHHQLEKRIKKARREARALPKDDDTLIGERAALDAELAVLERELAELRAASPGTTEEMVERAKVLGPQLPPEMWEVLPRRGFWWMEGGDADPEFRPGCFTVDIFWQRRGACKKMGGSCLWYQWDINAFKPELMIDRDPGKFPQIINQTDSTLLACFHCGLMPEDHEDLGPGQKTEEPGSFLPDPERRAQNGPGAKWRQQLKDLKIPYDEPPQFDKNFPAALPYTSFPELPEPEEEILPVEYDLEPYDGEPYTVDFLCMRRGSTKDGCPFYQWDASVLPDPEYIDVMFDDLALLRCLNCGKSHFVHKELGWCSPAEKPGTFSGDRQKKVEEVEDFATRLKRISNELQEQKQKAREEAQKKKLSQLENQ